MVKKKKFVLANRRVKISVQLILVVEKQDGVLGVAASFLIFTGNYLGSPNLPGPCCGWKYIAF